MTKDNVISKILLLCLIHGSTDQQSGTKVSTLSEKHRKATIDFSHT